MAIPLQQAQCRFHPERPGFAKCTSCKAVVCQECATRWNEALHCRTCLEQRRQQAATSQGRLSLLLCTSLAILAFFLLPRIMTWTLLFWSRWL